MTSISKNMCIGKLDDIVNEQNNTYQRTITMKLIYIKSSTYIDLCVENNDKDTNKIKNTVPWTYLIEDLNGEKIVGTFYEKELQKTNQTDFRIEKVIKKKGGKLDVKSKSYDNLVMTIVQNIFVCQPIFSTLVLKENNGSQYVITWKSKG